MLLQRRTTSYIAEPLGKSIMALSVCKMPYFDIGLPLCQYRSRLVHADVNIIVGTVGTLVVCKQQMWQRIKFRDLAHMCYIPCLESALLMSLSDIVHCNLGKSSRSGRSAIPTD